MRLTRRVWHFLAAILVASLVSGITLAVPPFYPDTLRYPDVALGVLVTGWFFSLPIVAIGGLLAGMPVAHILNSREVGGYWKWALAGGVVGALYSTVVFLMIAGTFPPFGYESISIPWLGVLPGIAAGLYWWRFVARKEQREVGPA